MDAPRRQSESFVNRKILVMGLPGAGKTTLALTLAPMLKAVWFNADAVRANINRELGYSPEDRIEQARRMGWLCDRVVEAGHTAMADFVCPTPEARAAFGDAFVVFVDRIKESRFEDTNRLFVPPPTYDLRIEPEGTTSHWAELIFKRLRQKLSAIT
jgi:Adenylylsulphate kinase